MVEIVDERVTRVWNYAKERYGAREDLVARHLAAWVLAVTDRRALDRDLPPVELVWRNALVVGVRADV